MTPSDIAESADLYSVRSVSEMLDLSAGQIRALVADDVITPTIGPRGKFFFSFQDLVLLRSIAHLVRAGVATQKVSAAVSLLRDQLPDDVSLAEVSLDATGRSIVVRVDAEAWEPVSGQTVLDLETRDATTSAVPVIKVPNEATQRRTAADWYAYADEIESEDPLAAEHAYRRAIDIDDGFAEAHLNLGRLLHAAGATRDALTEYQAALTLDASDATTHYNIGVASQDLGHLGDAVASYEQAITLAPRFADARYNLAALYENIGDTELAVQHLREYKDLLDGR